MSARIVAHRAARLQRSRLTAALVGPVLLACGPSAAAADPDALRYLLIDDHHVERAEGVQRVFHQPVKHEGPVVVPDRPWEESFIQLWNAPVWSPERGRWQMWYFGGTRLLPLYAESADGVTWEKPVLGLVSWKGSTENNIVRLGFSARVKENRIVLLRDDRDPDPARRYKGLTRVGGQLKALVSADGLDWKPLKADLIPTGDEYRLGYDALRGRFLATAKDRPPDGKGYGRRAVFLSLSDDFLSWTKPKLIFAGDGADQALGRERIEALLRDPDRRHPLTVRRGEYVTDIYNAPLFTYADLYLALPVVFNQTGGYVHAAGSNQDGVLYPSLAASRDLNKWDRLDRQPFLSPSPLSDADRWDYGAVQGNRPVERGDELWFYYTGARFTHVKRELIEQAGLRKSADEPLRGVFLARLRRDGFASLHAGHERGTIVTRPLEVTGSTLLVNVDARQGEFRAELRDPATGQAVPGYSFGDSRLRTESGPGGDGTRIAVGWKASSDLSKLRERKLHVAFSLRQAHLYGFWFADAEDGEGQDR